MIQAGQLVINTPSVVGMLLDFVVSSCNAAMPADVLHTRLCTSRYVRNVNWSLHCQLRSRDDADFFFILRPKYGRLAFTRQVLSKSSNRVTQPCSEACSMCASSTERMMAPLDAVVVNGIVRDKMFDGVFAAPFGGFDIAIAVKVLVPYEC